MSTDYDTKGRKPATRQRVLRQVLVAVLDVNAPKQIRFDDEDTALTFECDSAEDAHALAKVLRLRDQEEGGQPYPLKTTPELWTGTMFGTLLGWSVHIRFEAPFTGEYIERWRARNGFTNWPATAAVLEPDPCPAGDPHCETGDDGSCHDGCVPGAVDGCDCENCNELRAVLEPVA